jgi:hypothetical protein
LLDRVEDIDFEKLPNQFVLKTTHDCGGLVICPDKSSSIINNLWKKSVRRWTSLLSSLQEWPYKNVVPRIIAEEYIVDEAGTELKDYKIFVLAENPLWLTGL